MKINKMELIKKIVNLCPDQTELTPNELKDLLKEYNLDIGMEDNDVIKKEKEEITNHSESFTELRRFSRPEPKSEPKPKPAPKPEPKSETDPKSALNVYDSIKNSKMFDEDSVKNFKSFVSADDPDLPKFVRVALGMKQFKLKRRAHKVYPNGPEDIGLCLVNSIMSQSKCDPDYAIALASYGKLYPRFLALHPEVLKTQRKMMLLSRLLYKPILIKYIPKILEDYGEITYLKNMKEILKDAGAWEIRESLGQSYILSLTAFVGKLVTPKKFREFLYIQLFSHIVRCAKDKHSSFYIRHWNSIAGMHYKIDEDVYCRDFMEDINPLRTIDYDIHQDIFIYENPYNAFCQSHTATLEKQLSRLITKCMRLIDSLDSSSISEANPPRYSADDVRKKCYNLFKTPIKQAYKKGMHVPVYLLDLYNPPNGYKDLDLGEFYRAISILV